MVAPNVQVLELDKKEYVIIDKTEYQKMLDILENVEDIHLINEALEDNKSYTLDEANEIFRKYDNGEITDNDLDNL